MTLCSFAAVSCICLNANTEVSVVDKLELDTTKRSFAAILPIDVKGMPLESPLACTHPYSSLQPL